MGTSHCNINLPILQTVAKVHLLSKKKKRITEVKKQHPSGFSFFSKK